MSLLLSFFFCSLPIPPNGGIDCLFGEAVSTASRIEALSAADRITLSVATAGLLRQHAPELAAHLEPRGKLKARFFPPSIGRLLFSFLSTHAFSPPPLSLSQVLGKGAGALECFYLSHDPLTRERSRALAEAARFGPRAGAGPRAPGEAGRIDWCA